LVQESGGPWFELRILRPEKSLSRGNRRGDGDTDRIMVQPHKRGEKLYGTPDAAFFQAEIPLEKPTPVEIYTEAPLAYPHAIQKGSKTLTLILGNISWAKESLLNERIDCEHFESFSKKKVLKRGEEVIIRLKFGCFEDVPSPPEVSGTQINSKYGDNGFIEIRFQRNSI